MPRRKNIDVRRSIAKLYSQGVRSPSRIAQELGLPVSLVNYYMHAMRREGLLPKAKPMGGLLDEAQTLLKAISVRLSYVSSELVARGEPKLAKQLAEAEEFARRVMELINTYSKIEGLVKR